MASCLLTKLVLPLHQTTINSCQLPRPKHFIKPLHHQRYHRIHYCVYQKPHHKYTIHPRHIFTGIIKTETTRYIRLSITFDDFDYIHKIFDSDYKHWSTPHLLSTPVPSPGCRTHYTKDGRQTDSNTLKRLTVTRLSTTGLNATSTSVMTKLYNKFCANITICTFQSFAKHIAILKKLFSTLLTNKSLHQKLVV